MTPVTSLETKSASDDLNGAFEGFMRTFEAYKENNDERLRQIEKRSGDVLADEKMARLDRALDDARRVADHLALKAQRPQLASASVRSSADREHKAAFDSYLRKGDASAIARIEAKALSAGSNPDGGYTVPVEIETTVNHALRAISPIRSSCRILPGCSSRHSSSTLPWYCASTISVSRAIVGSKINT